MTTPTTHASQAGMLPLHKPPPAYQPFESAPLALVAWLFALLIVGVPIGQVAYELARGAPVQALDYLRPLTQPRHAETALRSLRAVALDLADEGRLRRFEEELRKASFLQRELLPWYQWLLVATFGHGNEKAVEGREQWLFFSEDLESAYGRGFLAEGSAGRAALREIADFRDQLRARGIDLLVIPSYSKEMLDAEMLSRFSAGITSAVNPDLEAFYAELTKLGVEFVRMDEIFARIRAEHPGMLALPRDSHWTPQTMAEAAKRIAARMRAKLGGKDGDSAASGGRPPIYSTRRIDVAGDGDLVRMLALPKPQRLYPAMRLSIEQVVTVATGELCVSDPKADVLLMGDSLTRIFGEKNLGLGEGAGLGEHLALELERPLDVIAIPGGSATATREALARRGPEGLAGKKLVVWQFGVRMLAAKPDEWRHVDLPKPTTNGAQGTGSNPDATTNPAADRLVVVGEMVGKTEIPKEFGYDKCAAVYKYKVLETVTRKLEGEFVWVCFPIIEQGKDIAPRSFTTGMRHRMTLVDFRKVDKKVFDPEHDAWFDFVEAGKDIYYPLHWEDAGH